MDFFIRLFSKKEKKISIGVFTAIAADPEFAEYSFEYEITDTHNQIVIKRKEREIALIIEILPEKTVTDNFKIKNVTEYAENKRPENASKWVINYLKKTKSIYEFIPVLMSDDKDWDFLFNAYMEAWTYNRGIFQIKNEGFTNESGDLVLWDYPFSATGKRLSAIRSFTGRWKTFEMNLESPMQRKAFFNGKVPDKSKLIYRG